MESTLRRTWAEIDLDALEYNYNTIRRHIGEGTRFLGVVKADAYGHGAIKVATVLQQAGADYLAVSSIDEAMELRLGGITMPILILGHTPGEQVERLIEYNITQAVSCMAKAEEYSKEVMRLRQAAAECAPADSAQAAAGSVSASSDRISLKIHIKVDTGMSRLGFLCDGRYFDTGVKGICDACALPGLEAEGIFTHFSVADEPEDEENVRYTKHQFKLFTDVIEEVQKLSGQTFRLRHCANTGATALYPEMFLDMVRPGLLLYGYGEFAGKLGLKPVMALKTTVSTIKTYPENTSVSYGRTYRTDHVTRVGVLPYGYADGFFRSLSGNYSFMTADGPAPVLGRICMDMCMADLTGLKNIAVGSEIEIFGRNNPIETMAEKASTIPYELTCAVSKRVPRIYIYEGNVIEKELMLRM